MTADPAPDSPASQVDVIVAVRDGARTIEDCVRSVLAVAAVAQVVVVDDGSTDATPEILAGIHDARLRVERVEHHSRARAANHALRLCTAPFVCSMDADCRSSGGVLPPSVVRRYAMPSRRSGRNGPDPLRASRPL